MGGEFVDFSCGDYRIYSTAVLSVYFIHYNIIRTSIAMCDDMIVPLSMIITHSACLFA